MIKGLLIGVSIFALMWFAGAAAIVMWFAQ